MDDDSFHEEQKFTQKWVLFIVYSLWVLFLIVSLLILLEKKAGLFLAFVPFLIISVFVLFFKSIKLQTSITGEGIYYRFFPIQRRFRVIKKTDIQKLEVKSYNPLREYGGWGIRFGKNGMAYTVKGDKGIDISLDPETHFLIGTSKSEEVEVFLRERGYNVR
ncbi:MAG TPA: hypothetical protein VKR41_00590 [Puia sp.]|nr:hypothetical protein [Puia sp.]